LELAAVVCPVQFPVAAGAAPAWTTIRFAHKHILAVEGLESGAVWIAVGPWLIPVGGFDVFLTAAALLPLGLLVGCALPEGCHSGIELDDDKNPDV
jgi:hypothetical protein